MNSSTKTTALRLLGCLLFIEALSFMPLGKGWQSKLKANACDLVQHAWNKHNWEFHPDGAWTGNLVERAERFAAQLPFNVVYLPAVKFEAKNYGTKRRGMLVISTDGLSKEQKKNVKAKYLQALARDVVTFPGDSGPDHLHARVGQWVFDWIDSITRKKYSTSTNGRIEPIIALSPTEIARLEYYIENVNGKPGRVLGEFDSDGLDQPQKVKGSLLNNKPKDGCEHNCTSWFSTAPIGENGERLSELVGAEIGSPHIRGEVFNSPFKWPGWLIGGASKARTPFIVIWVNRPVDQYAAKFDPQQNGETFKFGF